jgi:hypothetical protein
MKAKDQIKLMGKKVVVLFELARKFGNDNMRTWDAEQLDHERVGWIVGFRQLLNGKKISSSFYGDGDGDQGYIKETMKRTPAVMVAYWPTKAPVPVPEQGFRIVDDDTPVKSPYIWEGQWSERTKEDLREEMKKVKRDSKGRWLKG